VIRRYIILKVANVSAFFSSQKTLRSQKTWFIMWFSGWRAIDYKYTKCKASNTMLKIAFKYFRFSHITHDIVRVMVPLVRSQWTKQIEKRLKIAQTLEILIHLMHFKWVLSPNVPPRPRMTSMSQFRILRGIKSVTLEQILCVFRL
jgi:hypothetical protein